MKILVQRNDKRDRLTNSINCWLFWKVWKSLRRNLLIDYVSNTLNCFLNHLLSRAYSNCLAAYYMQWIQWMHSMHSKNKYCDILMQRVNRISVCLQTSFFVEMGRNYYCDYCDKRLKNDAQVIKKHIAGLAHTAARNEHYVKYKGRYCKTSNSDKRFNQDPVCPHTRSTNNFNGRVRENTVSALLPRWMQIWWKLSIQSLHSGRTIELTIWR